jgi:hypothetical protein
MMNTIYWSCLILRDDTIFYATLFLNPFELPHLHSLHYLWPLADYNKGLIRGLIQKSCLPANVATLLLTRSHHEQLTSKLRKQTAIMAQVQPQAEGTNGTSSNGTRPDQGGFKLKFCTVCASNNNRSVCMPLSPQAKY